MVSQKLAKYFAASRPEVHPPLAKGGLGGFRAYRESRAPGVEAGPEASGAGAPIPMRRARTRSVKLEDSVPGSTWANSQEAFYSATQTTSSLACAAPARCSSSAVMTGSRTPAWDSKTSADPT